MAKIECFKHSPLPTSERFMSRAKSSHLLVAQTARVGEDNQRIAASAALRLLIRFAPFLLHPSYFSLS